MTDSPDAISQRTLGYVIRSLFIVLCTIAAAMATSRQAGLTLQQSILIALPIGFFSASLITLYFLARSGRSGDKTNQLIILLAIELVLVPVGSAAAIVAYFL